MRFDILTLFPEMFPGALSAGVVGRALENKIWSYDVVNIRDFATDNYGSVDDAQFGGGVGMVMRPDVIAGALDSVAGTRGNASRKVIYFSPRGKVWNQQLARKMLNDFRLLPFDLCLLCGRYEGIDQRVIEEYDIEEISIGDYILSGGELAAQVFIDSIVRLMDNVVQGGPSATANESFEIGGLEWPLYTRPSAWRGRNVPEVLLSGHHGNIERWRKQQSDELTKQRRPDLLKENEK